MIDRIIHQIWIGPTPPPQKWLDTWTDKNPNWQYKLWDNEAVLGRKWKNQRIIDFYVDRYNEHIKGETIAQDTFKLNSGILLKGSKATYFAWHVIADVLRYEILHEYGGYMPGADSVCQECIDDKFTDDIELYTLRTGNLHVKQLAALDRRYLGQEITGRDKVLHTRYQYDNASPILGARKGHEFLAQCIQELNMLETHQLGEAVDTTGNVFMGKMIRKYKPDITMPDYTLRAERTNDYSIHYSGTTKNTYHLGR